MRFLVTLNMPSRKGELVHQVVCWYPCESIEDFLATLQNMDFILVEEFYRKQDNAGFYSVGMMIINTMHIGKVKVEASAER
jgi:23S rRNA A2030 N6-methylase RlmJ